MGKYNVRAYHVKAPLNLSKLWEGSVFQPCASGNEMSVGLIAAGPEQSQLLWKAKGLEFLEYAVEERRVPKKWLEAEVRRRRLPTHTAEEIGTLTENVKAELWQKIIPTKKYGWVCYIPDDNMLLVCGSVRHTEYVTGVLRQALGSLSIDNAFEVHAFELAVRDFISGDLEMEEISLGHSVNLYEGSGKGRTVVSFKNFDGLQENEHIADHMLRCKGVATAGFIVDGVEENCDDVVASPYAELVITEVKDKEADEYGTMLIRADRARTLVQILKAAIGFYTKDTGAKV